MVSMVRMFSLSLYTSSSVASRRDSGRGWYLKKNLINAVLREGYFCMKRWYMVLCNALVLKDVRFGHEDDGSRERHARLGDVDGVAGVPEDEENLLEAQELLDHIRRQT